MLHRIAVRELPQTLFTKLDYSLRELRELRKLEAADAARYALSHAPTVATDAGPLPLDQQGGLLERGYKALDDDKLLADLEALLRRFDEMVFEPQLSVPDVLIWVLTDDKRRAYLRIPVAEIFYHDDEGCRGANFGVPMTHFMKLPNTGKGDENRAFDVPAQIQFRAWYGAAEEVYKWPSPTGKVIWMSEVYENQSKYTGGFSALKVGSRKAWSDRTGKIDQKKENAKLPEGFSWASEWRVAPEVNKIDEEASLSSVRMLAA